MTKPMQIERVLPPRMKIIKRDRFLGFQPPQGEEFDTI